MQPRSLTSLFAIGFQSTPLSRYRNLMMKVKRKITFQQNQILMWRRRGQKYLLRTKPIDFDSPPPNTIRSWLVEPTNIAPKNIYCQQWTVYMWDIYKNNLKPHHQGRGCLMTNPYLANQNQRGRTKQGIQVWMWHLKITCPAYIYIFWYCALTTPFIVLEIAW